MEKRNILFSQHAPTVEKRDAADATPTTITGYGVVFYRADDPATEFVIPLPGGMTLRERIMPGALDAAMSDKRDVISCWNHDGGKVLGRRSKGTLTMSVDSVGLRYTVTPPATTWGRDALESVARGDVDGASFQFGKDAVSTFEEDRAGKAVIRTITSIKRIYEVGPVGMPAYEATGAEVRAQDDEVRDLLETAAKRNKDTADAEKQNQNDLNLKTRISITLALATLVE